ncbi:MAG: hypothetical protein IK062_00295 [Selenomonadaceae bacterium]|nr:hypothetical protein [Selenomonadaceae bacterium]
MKITRLKAKRGGRYCIDGEIVSRDTLDEICKKFLNAEGLAAMWHKVIDSGVCVIDLDFDRDENKILAIKNAELAKEREKNAALEKKLMQFKIKAAKYDGLISAMRTQTV